MVNIHNKLVLISSYRRMHEQKMNYFMGKTHLAQQNLWSSFMIQDVHNISGTIINREVSEQLEMRSMYLSSMPQRQVDCLA